MCTLFCVFYFLYFFYDVYFLLFKLFIGQIDPEHAIPEDKPSKCAADQKTSDTGVYVDIHVEESDNPLPRVSDDKTVTYSQPRFEKMDRPLNDDLSDPTRHDETKFDEQDFDEKDINIRSHKPCVDSDKEVPPVPTQREVSCIQ